VRADGYREQLLYISMSGRSGRDTTHVILEREEAQPAAGAGKRADKHNGKAAAGPRKKARSPGRRSTDKRGEPPKFNKQGFLPM
jgi:hypothetical protein